MRLYENSLVGRFLTSRFLLLPAVGRNRQQSSIAKIVSGQATGNLGYSGCAELSRYIEAWLVRASLQLKSHERC